VGIVLERYRAGINVGGWISQSSLAPEHVAGFVGRADVERIASWGLDHVRLPFDYPVLESDARPFEYAEEGFAAIDRMLGWCKASNLSLVLDMHRAPGYAFGAGAEENVLFSDEGAQRRFVSLWREIARRYRGEGDGLAFELLNEIVDARGEGWNRVARMAIEAIRGEDPSRHVLLGGAGYNSAAGLEALELWADERVLYNFHFYEPFLFTHQMAPWTPLGGSGVSQRYPGRIEGLERLKAHFGGRRPETREPIGPETVFDRAYLAAMMAPAAEFARRTGRQLYCGEYGAIDLADLESRIRWLSDASSLLEELGIGRACWTYKGMSFSALGGGGEPVSREMIGAIAAPGRGGTRL